MAPEFSLLVGVFATLISAVVGTMIGLFGGLLR